MHPIPRPIRRLGATAFLLFAATAAAAAQAVAIAASPQVLSTGQDAPPVELLERPARLAIEDLSLRAALAELRHRAGVPLVFSEDFIPTEVRVSCACASVTVREALDRLLAGTELRYAELRTQVLIEPTPYPAATTVAANNGLRAGELLRPVFAYSATVRPLSRSRLRLQGTVRGTVTAANTMRPLGGAQISIPGTGQGSLTNSAGEFLIVNVPVGEQTVRVQMIGYNAAEEPVRIAEGQVVTVDFQLSESAIALDEIVVTGTAGAVQKRAIGNTVAQINASDVMEVASISNVTELVTARVPGVVVRPAAGTAGAGARIKIRGTSSLTLDTQPLIYVDGVRVDNAVATGPGIQGGNVTSRLNDINPDDIESLEIIKGPAAATLYGTEAASGVIQIITKKGRPDQLNIGFTMRQGATWFSNPEDRFPTNWYRGPETNGELRSLNIVEAENARGTPIFRTGHLQGYGLNLSGGSENFQFYAAGDFDRDEGVERPNVATRYSGRANISITPASSFDVQTSLGLTVVRTDLAREESPTQSVTGATLRANPRVENTASRGFFAVPPEAIWEVFSLNQDVDRFTGSVKVNHRPTDWFTHRLTAGGDLVHENNEALVPNLPPSLAQFFNPQFATGFKNINQREVTNTTVDYGGTLTYPLREGLTSRTSAGWQYYRKFQQFFAAEGNEFPAAGVTTVSAAAIRFGAEDFVENVTVGSYLQQEFSLNNRLFLTGAVRADDNSAFGRDFDIQVYPKISGSWVVSEEPFWNARFLNVLRLRGAFGASGQQPDAFAAIRTFEPVTGTNDRSATTPQSLGNSELGPERGQELELGFEAGFLQDRVNVDFTFYHQTTKDAILLAPVAPSTGFPGSRFINAGEVRNRGVELLLATRPVVTRKVSWDLALNLSTTDNEIISLGGQGPIGTTGTSPAGPVAEHRVGYPPYSFFLKRVVSAELDAEGNAINILCDGGSGNNNQPLLCADAPRLFMGNLEPDLQGALSSAVTLFDRLRLYALFDFQTGRTQFAEDNWVRCSIYRICLENFEPQQFDPRRIAEVQLGGSDLVRSIYYNNADFAKLREVSLSYAVSDRLAERFGAKRAIITFAGRNLHTWTSYPGLDPETSKLGLVGGFNQAQVPLMSEFSMTVNLTF